jgi:hypothetical protein
MATRSGQRGIPAPVDEAFHLVRSITWSYGIKEIQFLRV